MNTNSAPQSRHFSTLSLNSTGLIPSLPDLGPCSPELVLLLLLPADGIREVVGTVCPFYCRALKPAGLRNYSSDLLSAATLAFPSATDVSPGRGIEQDRRIEQDLPSLLYSVPRRKARIICILVFSRSYEELLWLTRARADVAMVSSIEGEHLYGAKSPYGESYIQPNGRAIVSWM